MELTSSSPIEDQFNTVLNSPIHKKAGFVLQKVDQWNKREKTFFTPNKSQNIEYGLRTPDRQSYKQDIPPSSPFTSTFDTPSRQNRVVPGGLAGLYHAQLLKMTDNQQLDNMSRDVNKEFINFKENERLVEINIKQKLQLLAELEIAQNDPTSYSTPSREDYIKRRRTELSNTQSFTEEITMTPSKQAAMQKTNVVLELQNTVREKLTEIDQYKNQSRELNDEIEALQAELQVKDTYVKEAEKLKKKIETLEETIKVQDDIKSNDTSPEKVEELKKELKSAIEKYNEEFEMRRSLYNELQELRGNIRVFCRVRPLNENEGKRVAEVANNAVSLSRKKFDFDRVFDSDTTQESIFREVQPLIVSVLDGYNVCIFAYGQTGSGKSYTMDGNAQNRGVNWRALSELFQTANERKRTHSYDISVNILEIYNEQIVDLLAPQNSDKKYEIKIGSNGVHVPDLSSVNVNSVEEIWEIMSVGSQNRSVGKTDCNEHSSRSHLILTVNIRGEAHSKGSIYHARLHLVDLAGSERISKSGVTGDRLKEAQHINKSLSALGNVVSALVSRSSHIPYRDSKLTYLLKDALGGDSKTLMFVQISLADYNEAESLSSLQFASRVKSIVNGPARQNVVDNSGMIRYRDEAKKLKEENDELRREVMQRQEASSREIESLKRQLDQRDKSTEQREKNLEQKEKQFEQREKNLEMKEKQSMERSLTLREKPNPILKTPRAKEFVPNNSLPEPINNDTMEIDSKQNTSQFNFDFYSKENNTENDLNMALSDSLGARRTVTFAPSPFKVSAQKKEYSLGVTMPLTSSLSRSLTPMTKGITAKVPVQALVNRSGAIPAPVSTWSKFSKGTQLSTTMPTTPVRKATRVPVKTATIKSIGKKTSR